MLTASQLATLKAAIVSDPALNGLPNNSDGNYEIAAQLNAIASPTWVVWRTDVSRREILQSNGFDWTRLDNLSVGKARIWSDIFIDGLLNPSKPNVRAGIEAVWVGTAADLAVRSQVLSVCKTEATRAQRLFSSGLGSLESPATLGDGISEYFQLNYQDVETARNLP